MGTWCEEITEARKQLASVALRVCEYEAKTGRPEWAYARRKLYEAIDEIIEAEDVFKELEYFL